MYGSRPVGFGHVASVGGRLLAEPCAPAQESRTECLWLGIAEVLSATQATSGLVAVLDTDGSRVAVVDVGGDVPSYGGLDWVMRT